MRKKELLTRIEALERKIAQQADLIEQLRLGQMKFGPGVVKPAEPLTPWGTRPTQWPDYPLLNPVVTCKDAAL